jgi:hypothetical protein
MRRALVLVSLVLTLAAVSPARAEEVTDKSVGIGYKLGNGIGFIGADLILALVPAVTLDLQFAFLPVDDGTVWATAPALQFRFLPRRVGTPYLAIGMQFAYLSTDNDSASAWGGFANLGYEWRFRGGLGILLGAGVQYLAEAKSGTTSIGGDVNPNFEVGLRYFF